MAKCSVCGAPVDSDIERCPYCRSDLRENTMQLPPVAAPPVVVNVNLDQSMLNQKQPSTAKPFAAPMPSLAAEKSQKAGKLIKSLFSKH
jgi:hypothetical protein